MLPVCHGKCLLLYLTHHTADADLGEHKLALYPLDGEEKNPSPKEVRDVSPADGVKELLGVKSNENLALVLYGQSDGGTLVSIIDTRTLQMLSTIDFARDSLPVLVPEDNWDLMSMEGNHLTHHRFFGAKRSANRRALKLGDNSDDMKRIPSLEPCRHALLWSPRDWCFRLFRSRDIIIVRTDPIYDSTKFDKKQVQTEQILEMWHFGTGQCLHAIDLSFSHLQLKRYPHADFTVSDDLRTVLVSVEVKLKDGKQTYFIDLSKSSESASPKKRRLNSFHGQRLKQPQPLFKSTMATQLWGRRWQSHRRERFSDSHPLVEGLFVAMPHCTRPHIEIRFHVNDGEVI